MFGNGYKQHPSLTIDEYTKPTHLSEHVSHKDVEYTKCGCQICVLAGVFKVCVSMFLEDSSGIYKDTEFVNMADFWKLFGNMMEQFLFVYCECEPWTEGSKGLGWYKEYLKGVTQNVFKTRKLGWRYNTFCSSLETWKILSWGIGLILRVGQGT